MWLRGKALSSHALPPDRSLQNRDPTRGHATQEPCHRLLDRGPTSGSPAWADFAAPARTDFTAGTSDGCFRRGKIPVDSTTKFPTGRGRIRLKKNRGKVVSWQR